MAEIPEYQQDLQELSIVASQISNGVVIMDGAGLTEWLNNSYTEITGYTMDDLRGKQPGDILTAECSNPRTLARIRAASAHGEGWHEEIEVHSKGGKPIWLEISNTPVYEDDGKVSRQIEIINDITEKKKTEEEVKRLSIVARNMDEAVLITDARGNIEFYNEGLTRNSGFTPKEFAKMFKDNMSLQAISSKENIQEIIDGFQESEETVYYDSSHERKDGSLMWTTASLSPVYNEGALEKIIVVYKDITERRKHVKQLEVLTNRLNVINSVDRSILKADSVKDAMQSSILELKSQLPFERASITLFDYEKQVFVNHNVITQIDAKVLKEGEAFPLADFGSLPTLEEGDYKVECDLSKKKNLSESDKRLMEDGITSYLCYPLRAHEILLGSLNLATPDPAVFDQNMMTIIEEVASGIALALYGNQLQEKLAESNRMLNQKNEDITASIRYAGRIQETILPQPDAIETYFEDSFVLFQPRDIVSGDFYFVERIRTNDQVELVGFSVVDCTGHGVPGAFMSMVGYSYMKQSLTHKDVTTAAEAMDFVNGKVMELTSHTDVNDGMDVAFCVLHQPTLNMQFVGAGNPLWFIRDGELHEYRPDKLAIGSYMWNEKEEKFTNHEIQMQKGDCIYLSSDGYADQFGGADGRKFMQRRMKELLVEIHEKPMTEQCELLEKAHWDWRGDQYQVDDICVMGIRL